MNRYKCICLISISLLLLTSIKANNFVESLENLAGSLSQLTAAFGKSSPLKKDLLNKLGKIIAKYQNPDPMAYFYAEYDLSDLQNGVRQLTQNNLIDYNQLRYYRYWQDLIQLNYIKATATQARLSDPTFIRNVEKIVDNWDAVIKGTWIPQGQVITTPPTPYRGKNLLEPYEEIKQWLDGIKAKLKF